MQQDLRYGIRGADKVAASHQAKTRAGICLCRMPLSTLEPALYVTLLAPDVHSACTAMRMTLGP